MLKDRSCYAMLPAGDIERAKSWYADKLDLKPIYEDEGGVEYRNANGTGFGVYPSQFAGTNQATAMGFLTDDIEKDMEDLRARGVTFEEYDIPGIQTKNGIAEFAEGEKGSWFKDSEGNIIAIVQSTRGRI